jgi:4-methyl-5(b-hydroxyethyl)-thiazole monophosphate biosynthesis
VFNIAHVRPIRAVILAEGFEEIEAVTPVDILRRAGAAVTLACLGEGVHVTGRSGLTVHADKPLAAAGEGPFDCILLPGGPGVAGLRADPRVLLRVKLQAEGGGWIAAICAAPTVLKDAGVLGGLRHTAHPSVAAELPDALLGERVVVDGRLITSRGAGTALDFGLMLVEKLFSSEKASEISRSIRA